MVEQVELSSIDLRYESHRLKNPVSEKALLASISEYGFKEPLKGVDSGDIRILLDGFKRYRCAKKQGIPIVPYTCISNDEALGIIEILRMSLSKKLNILEQAKLIDELISMYKMSYSEIATHLEKSKSWVSMRAGLIGKMSEAVMDKIFSGKFPAYSFMYHLRPFIRMNGIRMQDVDRFVESVSGKGLSIREIGVLSKSYFRGTEDFRSQVIQGDIQWCLEQLEESSGTDRNCSKKEKKLLKDLEMVGIYMNRVVYCGGFSSLCSNHFLSQAQILTSGILKRLKRFEKIIEKLHDRFGKP